MRASVTEKRAGHSGGVLGDGNINEGEIRELGHPTHIRSLDFPPIIFYYYGQIEEFGF